MSEDITQDDRQPKMLFRRWMAFVALGHFLVYSMVKSGADINSWVIAFDAVIIAYWAIGGAALVDAILTWKGEDGRS